MYKLAQTFSIPRELLATVCGQLLLLGIGHSYQCCSPIVDRAYISRRVSPPQTAILTPLCVYSVSYVSLPGYREQALDWQTAPPVHVLSFLVLGSEKDAKCWEVRYTDSGGTGYMHRWLPFQLVFI